MALALVAAALVAMALVAPLVSWAIPFARSVRILIAVATLVPIGMVLGIPMPTGIRLLSARARRTW